jgi:hypothetical protein
VYTFIERTSKETKNYTSVLGFYIEHPKRTRENMIRSFRSATGAQRSVVVPAIAGDATTWGRRSMDFHTTTIVDPPLDREEA